MADAARYSADGALVVTGHPGAPPLLTAIAFVASYVALDVLTHVRPLYIGVSPWSPQAGLALAYLVIAGWRGLPASLLAIVAGEIIARHAPIPAPLTYAAALWLGLGFAAIAGVLRRTDPGLEFVSARQATRFAGICLVGVLVLATGYIGLYASFGSLPKASAPSALVRLWIANLNGVLTITPLLLLAPHWRKLASVAVERRGALAGALLIVALLLAVIFKLPANDQLRFFYLLFVPIVWIALRWRWHGALLAVLVIQIGLVIVAETRIPTARFIDLQFLMLTLTLTALLLGAVVAERAELLARITTREAEQRALLAMAPDAVLVTDTAGVVRSANAAAARLFGDAVAIAGARTLVTLIPQLQFDVDMGRAERSAQRADGTPFPAEVAWAKLESPASRGFLVIVRDVTDRTRSEEQLRERDAALAGAMRFAVAGELASALAHELNQPITALVSYLHACEILADRTPRDDTRLKATLGKSVQEAIRAADVLHRLRDFYRGAAPKREAVHLPTLCRSVVNSFADRLRKVEAVVEESLGADIPAIEADGTHLAIVLHNLLANALDAVSRAEIGQRRIALRITTDANVVSLRIEDSGPGIAADLRDKLFDPFVSDKASGMGLGLAISRSLVEARGGTLSLLDDDGSRGAAFVLSLPVVFPSDADAG